jgi:hypothetical protein
MLVGWWMLSCNDRTFFFDFCLVLFEQDVAGAAVWHFDQTAIVV